MSRAATASGAGASTTGPGANAMDGFQALRQEQRALAAKLSELEGELTEHRVVMETLAAVSGDRKCYHLVGGVLFEKTAAEVLPTLSATLSSLAKVVESLTEQLARKGQEINDYKDKHDIKVGGPDFQRPTAPTTPTASSTTSATTGVLVADS